MASLISREGQEFLSKLPSIDGDRKYKRYCILCAVGEKKCIKYNECEQCRFLSMKKLDNISARIRKMNSILASGDEFQEGNWLEMKFRIANEHRRNI